MLNNQPNNQNEISLNDSEIQKTKNSTKEFLEQKMVHPQSRSIASQTVQRIDQQITVITQSVSK
jgi:hypothetical protein